MPRVVLIAGFDSGLKVAGRLADAIVAAGAEVELRIPTTEVPHRLGPAQIRAATDRRVRPGTWRQILASAAAADAVVPIFDGPVVERVIRELHREAAPRTPVVGAGYIGMALYDLVGGYLMRSLADVVAVNSRSDLAVFARAAAQLDLPTDNLLLTGLALLPASPLPQRAAVPRTVLLADQPTVPRTAVARGHLWDRLLGYALAHPDREVLLRPRHRPSEDTFHRMRHSPEAWAASRRLPANLRIVHDPVDTLIPRTDLLLTVSSTAALEAVAAGCAVAFVADWLDDDSLNPPLIPSGLLRRFDDIDADRLGRPDPAWLDDVFPAPTGPAPAERFARRLLAAVEDPALRVHSRMWQSGYHRSRRARDAALAAARGRPTPRRLAAGALRRALAAVDP